VASLDGKTLVDTSARKNTGLDGDDMSSVSFNRTIIQSLQLILLLIPSTQFQELLEQKKKEAERQKVVRDRELKLEAEREEREKAERVKVSLWNWIWI
jgi:heme/copper-type cytochrome/quinol oxidase subunit 2